MRCCFLLLPVLLRAAAAAEATFVDGVDALRFDIPTLPPASTNIEWPAACEYTRQSGKGYYIRTCHLQMNGEALVVHTKVANPADCYFERAQRRRACTSCWSCTERNVARGLMAECAETCIVCERPDVEC
jgi:hypothetical protein